MNEIAGMLVSALGQGFIYAPMALGVFLTFSILKTPDLTVDRKSTRLNSSHSV